MCICMCGVYVHVCAWFVCMCMCVCVSLSAAQSSCATCVPCLLRRDGEAARVGCFARGGSALVVAAAGDKCAAFIGGGRGGAEDGADGEGRGEQDKGARRRREKKGIVGKIRGKYPKRQGTSYGV